MNIRVKAGVETVIFVISAMAIGAVIRLGLDYLSAVYGKDEVANAAIFAVITVFTFLMIKFGYDIRVGQLEYKNKLNEMIKK